MAESSSNKYPNWTNWSGSSVNMSDIGDIPLFSGYPDQLLDFAVVACIIFILVGVPGNFITILALLRYSKVRNATAMFIINLSVSDLMFCCFNLPLATSLFYKRTWTHGETLCTLFPFMRYGLLAVSIFTVLAITLNRYIMIGHPRLYPKLYRRRHLVLMIALTWLGSFGSLLPTLFGKWGVFGLDAEIGSCSILQDEEHRTPKEFLFVFAFVLPCLAIIICYARIFFIVRKAAAVSHGQQPILNTCSEKVSGENPNHPKCQAGPKLAYKPNLETSFNLTCCESQQGSGSTDISDETNGDRQPPSSDLTTETLSSKANTILRWKDSSKSLIRIEVERGSEAETLDVARESVDEKKERRISVTFDIADGEMSPPVLSTDQRYLRVPSGTASRSPSLSSNKSVLLCEAPFRDGSSGELASPVHSEASSGGSYQPEGRSPAFVFNTALSQVSGAFQRRSTLRSKTRHPGKMTAKDRKLLQMILVIFVSFIVCYMPITIVKSMSKEMDLRVLNIFGYVLIYLTTCINPIIYVVMSSEYRQAYKNLLTCKRNFERGPVPSRSYSQKA